MPSIPHRDPPGISPGDRVRLPYSPHLPGTVVDKTATASGVSVSTVLVDQTGACVQVLTALLALETPPAAAVTVATFGYLHGDPPSAHITLDLRTHFRDPHVSPELRGLTALDGTVRDAVLNTPGVRMLVEATGQAVLAYLSGPADGPVSVAVGCAGGRHRAATFGMALVEQLGAAGLPASLNHRDLDKPEVRR